MSKEWLREPFWWERNLPYPHTCCRRWGGLLTSTLIPLHIASASSLPGVLYCGNPGWHFTPQGWTQVPYGVGQPTSWLNNGPTAVTYTLTVYHSVTYSIQTGVSLSAQVDAIVASVNTTLSVFGTTSYSDGSSYSATTSIDSYRYGVAQKASLYENVTGTLYYENAYCQTSQIQTVSSSIPLISGLQGESNGDEPSPYPSWPTK